MNKQVMAPLNPVQSESKSFRDSHRFGKTNILCSRKQFFQKFLFFHYLFRISRTSPGI